MYGQFRNGTQEENSDYTLQMQLYSGPSLPPFG